MALLMLGEPKRKQVRPVWKRHSWDPEILNQWERLWQQWQKIIDLEWRRRRNIYPWFSLLMWGCIIAPCKKSGRSLLSLRNPWGVKDSSTERTLYCLAVRTAGLGAKGKMTVCYESRETQYCHSPPFLRYWWTALHPYTEKDLEWKASLSLHWQITNVDRASNIYGDQSATDEFVDYLLIL